jgi:surface protein
MSQMFSGAIVFNSDLSGWNVSKVTNMNEMFRDAYAFDQNLSIWYPKECLKFNRMFSGAFSTTVDNAVWNVGGPFALRLLNAVNNFGASAEAFFSIGSLDFTGATMITEHHPSFSD